MSMKIKYLLLIVFLLPILNACTENESVNFENENRVVIKYLENKYKTKIVFTSTIISDSALVRIEEFLTENKESIKRHNERSKAIRDSLELIRSLNLPIFSRSSSSRPYPIMYPIVEAQSTVSSNLITVSSNWLSGWIRPELSVIANPIRPTTISWNFAPIRLRTLDEQFRELCFDFKGASFVIFEGVGISDSFHFVGEMSHYQGWSWIDVKML